MANSKKLICYSVNALMHLVLTEKQDKELAASGYALKSRSGDEYKRQGEISPSFGAEDWDAIMEQMANYYTYKDAYKDAL